MSEYNTENMCVFRETPLEVAWKMEQLAENTRPVVHSLQQKWAIINPDTKEVTFEWRPIPLIDE